MSSKSAFLPRISLQRDSSSVLPLHNNPTTSSVRKKPSEYDLSDLSPRPHDASPYTQHLPNTNPSSEYRTSTAYSDRSRSMSGSPSKTRSSRVMFAGPPPPIAASRILYRDEEEMHRPHQGPSMSVSTLARNINSVLFDRGTPGQRTRDSVLEYEPDTVWRNLQRRERKLQKELQLLLDAQSTGLAGNLDPAAAADPRSSNASDAGSSTPTGTFYTSTSTRRSHVLFEEAVRSPSTGEIVPVRQPRTKPLGLRAARAGIAKNIALLADIKAEEDANLSTALSARKKALAQLRKLAARRDGIADELHVLEGEEEEPLAVELRELGEEHAGVTAEIAELEERLVGLRNRRRWLDAKMEDVRNRREAGLSGYKGALKEVEGKVAAILTRPPVRPLDPEVVVGQGAEAGALGPEEIAQSSGGMEFLRMRPERRTVEMARDWWESEVAILERRKKEVDVERAALEEGVEVWRAAYKLVAEYEADLLKEMRGGAGDGGRDDKGKGKAATPEEAMRAQLAKMSSVMATLQKYQQVAESKGWNLLICAIGAEHAAFMEAEAMLRETLRSANFETGSTRRRLACLPSPAAAFCARRQWHLQQK
ncbi:hypothetical protein QBC39DRAFT_392097 [Podospora conica]|nr:hypothetical protein QBC39DRAFT_392097 [Schizothecium conicum]